jgi:hypothetical protein
MRTKSALKKTGFIALPIAIIIGVLVYFAVSGAKTTVPPSFTAARQNAASVSHDIVTLTTSVNQNIQAANAAEAKGDTNAVLAAIGDARTANAAAYEKAFALSQNLQQMTQALTDINSAPSRQMAYEAVAVELSLVSEFIAYTGSLNDFLNTLARSIAVDGLSGNSAVADVLKIVNDRAATIDKLNQEFNQKMDAFDASVK